MACPDLPDVLIQCIMWAVFFRCRPHGAATICRAQLVNSQWRRCYQAIDADGRTHGAWVLNPSYVPNHPTATHWLAFYPRSTALMVDNRRRAHRQGQVARKVGMSLHEWRQHEAKRLMTSIKAIKNGCKGTVQ